MKVRKKPVVVEAVQLRWDTWSEMCEHAGVGRLVDVETKIARSHSEMDHYREQRDRLQLENHALKMNIKQAKKLIVTLIDDEECSLDHSSNCQTHRLGNPCEVAVARNFLLTAIKENK